MTDLTEQLIKENKELEKRNNGLHKLISELEAENTKLKTENKWYSEQLNEAVKEVGHLKELLTMVKPVLQLEYNVAENRNLIKKINQVLGEE